MANVIKKYMEFCQSKKKKQNQNETEQTKNTEHLVPLFFNPNFKNIFWFYSEVIETYYFILIAFNNKITKWPKPKKNNKKKKTLCNS